jgi:hypothetical protein
MPFMAGRSVFLRIVCGETLTNYYTEVTELPLVLHLLNSRATPIKLLGLQAKFSKKAGSRREKL